MSKPSITTFGQLKESGYVYKTIKEEVRHNLIKSLKNKEAVFTGIKGYEDTVIPQLQTALLSGHNVLLLGLRGQAKTKIARLITRLLDDWIPVVKGTILNENPFAPLTTRTKKHIELNGDKTEIDWIPGSERYYEKLATPDVSVPDLIGDIDPIKAANLKISLSDEDAIHYGMIPRSNRSVFVINELPDLQARIQVSLFNILQEGDIQIRGFNLRMPLDILFVFTANPEDYTNRGSIVTPLKDRIESQILTHYPNSIELSKEITAQEARLTDFQKRHIVCQEILSDLIEQIAFEARESEYVDQKSGVSARLTISAYEMLYSAAERRLLINNESGAEIRVSDMFAVIPAITGKIELVYEGELEGMANVAQYLISRSIRVQFEIYFPSPENKKDQPKDDPYKKIVEWFRSGNKIELLRDEPSLSWEKKLDSVPGLSSLVKEFYPDAEDGVMYLLMEFTLHGMAEYSKISRHVLESGIRFKDFMSDINFDFTFEDEEDNS